MFFAVLFGFLGIVYYSFFLFFSLSLFSDVKSLQDLIIALLIVLIPLVLLIVFGQKFFRNYRNNKPICILTSNELIYTEYNKRSTQKMSIPLNEIKNVSLKNSYFRKKIIALELIHQNQTKKLNYLNGIMSEEDKIQLHKELLIRMNLENPLY